MSQGRPADKPIHINFIINQAKNQREFSKLEAVSSAFVSDFQDRRSINCTSLPAHDNKKATRKG